MYVCMYIYIYNDNDSKFIYFDRLRILQINIIGCKSEECKIMNVVYQ